MTDEEKAAAAAAAGSILSEKDEQVLHYLTLVTNFLHYRESLEKPKEPKTFRGALREPTVVSALVTVLIGGIAATLITGMIQWWAASREFDQTWLKSRGDQALVSYKEYLDQEKDLMKRTYALIGASISASDRLTNLTKTRWRQRFVGAELRAVRTQMRDIRANYNKVDAQWSSEGEELGLLMGYYHPGQPQVLSSWKSVKDAVTIYQKCAEDWPQSWYKEHPGVKGPPTDEEVDAACKPKYDELLIKLNDLTQSLESARRYAWTGWESPKQIRELINNK